MAFRSLPISLRDLLLSFHSPICSEQFAGNPRYTLYWCYNKEALKELLGMTKDQYRVVHSRLGTFMRRTPETDLWLTRLLNHGRINPETPLSPSGDSRLKGVSWQGGVSGLRAEFSDF